MNARAQPITYVPLTASLRQRIEATVEELIGLLDELDGDPQPEPSLGWPERWLHGTLRHGGVDDRADDEIADVDARI